MDNGAVPPAEEAPFPGPQELVDRAAAHHEFFTQLRAETNGLYAQMKGFVADKRRLEKPLYAQFGGREGGWEGFLQLKQRFELRARECQEEMAELAAAICETLPVAAEYEPGFFKAVLTAAEKHPDSERECLARLAALADELGGAEGEELLRDALRKHYCVFLGGVIVSLGASMQKADDLHGLIADFKRRNIQFMLDAQPLLRVVAEQVDLLRNGFEQFLTQLRAACRSLPGVEIEAHVRKRFEAFAEVETRPAAELLEATVCMLSAQARAANVPLEMVILPSLVDFTAEKCCALQGEVADKVGELSRLSNLGALPSAIDEEELEPPSIWFPSLTELVQKLCALSRLRRPSDPPARLAEAVSAAASVERDGRVDFDAVVKCSDLFRVYLTATAPAPEELALNDIFVGVTDREELFTAEAVDQDLKSFLRVGSQLLETDSEVFLSREAELIDLKARFARMARESEQLCAKWPSLAPFRESQGRLFRALTAMVSQRLLLLQDLFRLSKAVMGAFSDAFSAAENLSHVRVDANALYPPELVEKVLQAPVLDQALRNRVQA